MFPIAFLLLMVPLPEIIFNRIAFPLQMLASRVGEGVIAASGVPVLREGDVLMLPGRTLEVAEACSGIRSALAAKLQRFGEMTRRHTLAAVQIRDRSRHAQHAIEPAG